MAGSGAALAAGAAPKKSGGKSGKSGKRRVSRGGSSMSRLDTAVTAAEIFGANFAASTLAARFPDKATVWEKADGSGGFDSRMLVGATIGALTLWKGKGAVRKHGLALTTGLLSSYVADKGRVWGEDMLVKANASSAPADSAPAASGYDDVGEIDPETGAITPKRAANRARRLDKRIAALRNRREKLEDRAGIDQPAPRRRAAPAPAFRGGRRALGGGEQFVQVPISAVRPGYLASRISGADDSDDD